MSDGDGPPPMDRAEFRARVAAALDEDLEGLPDAARDLLERAEAAVEARERDDHTVWVEVRVSQGHDYAPDEINEVSAAVEQATDVPASRAFCTAERNLLFCYLRVDANRLPVGRLDLFQHELRRAADGWTGRAVDEINVVDEAIVAERVPSAV